jgi:hypothetical protein
LNEKIDVKSGKAAGNVNYILSCAGIVYKWPTVVSNNTVHFSPKEIILPKVKINSLSCGKGFIMLLSVSGLLYS